jgi:hypothetical protein
MQHSKVRQACRILLPVQSDSMTDLDGTKIQARFLFNLLHELSQKVSEGSDFQPLFEMTCAQKMAYSCGCTEVVQASKLIHFLQPDATENPTQ